MGLFDTIMADTVGKVYEAASGTVDPWTKDQQIQEATAAIVQASNGTIDQATAQAQATADVTAALTTSIDPATGQPMSADPTDFWAGVNNSIKKLGNNLNNIATTGSKSMLYFGIGILLIVAAIYVVPVIGKAGKAASGE